jgi:hypothetical protein
MPPNPKRLNALQLKTLTLLQEIARHPLFAEEMESGDVRIRMMPEPHGDHFHIGSRVVLSRDATGLQNRAVHAALSRKGCLDQLGLDGDLVVTRDGMDYPTGLRDKILHGSDH